MSPLANGAAAVLGLWLVANFCFAMRVPGIHTALRRVNWFRTFARWTMFGEPSQPDKPGSYSLEYRDRMLPHPAGEWQATVLSHQRHPAGFLLDLRRPVAEALQTLCLSLEVSLDRSTTTDASATLRKIEYVLERHLEETWPMQPHRTREIRVVKMFGRRRAASDMTLWSSAAKTPARRA